MVDGHEVVARSTRLLLARPVAGDEPALRVLRQDARVMHHLGGAAGDAVTARLFARDLAHWEIHGFGTCVLFDRSSGRFVGACGLQLFEGEPDLEYLLAPPWWGRGLATEAARAALAHGFASLGLRLVRATTTSANRASQRVLSKVGMRYLHDRVLWGARQRCYAITAGEWQSRGLPESPRGSSRAPAPHPFEASASADTRPQPAIRDPRP